MPKLLAEIKIPADYVIFDNSLAQPMTSVVPPMHAPTASPAAGPLLVATTVEPSTVEVPDEGNPTTDTVVLNMVVHRLLKQDDGFHASLRADPNAGSPTTEKVVKLLIEEYAKRTGKSHGQFEEDLENYPVQGFLRAHFSDKSKDFVTMSSDMMRTLCAKARSTAATAGGVIFAHTKNNNEEHIIIAIVTEEWGAALGDGLEVSSGEYLDLKGFRFAGRVNITDWLANKEKYLSFLKGKGQEVSGYFKSFLGCANSVTYSADTKSLKGALEEFAIEQQLNEVDKKAFFDLAYEICAKNYRSHTPLYLEEFANQMWPGEPEKLAGYFVANDRKISDGFIPDKRVFNSFVKFSAKTDTWKIEFSRDAIQNHHILFNDNETLTVKNLPPELKERLRREKSESDE